MVKAAAAGTRKKMRLTSLKALRQNSGTKLTRESCFGIRFFAAKLSRCKFLLQTQNYFLPIIEAFETFLFGFNFMTENETFGRWHSS